MQLPATERPSGDLSLGVFGVCLAAQSPVCETIIEYGQMSFALCQQRPSGKYLHSKPPGRPCSCQERVDAVNISLLLLRRRRR